MGFDPITLLVIGIGAVVAGTAVQMYGAAQQAKATATMYEYNAEVNRREAEQQRKISLEEQQIKRDELRRHLAAQRVAYAKAGVTPAGSPTEVMLQTVEDYSADIAMLALGRETAARRFESAAGLDVYRAGYARAAGPLQVGAALFGGISQTAQMGISYHLVQQGKV